MLLNLCSHKYQPPVQILLTCRRKSQFHPYDTNLIYRREKHNFLLQLHNLCFLMADSSCTKCHDLLVRLLQSLVHVLSTYSFGKAHNFISEVNKILFIRFNCFFTVAHAAGLCSVFSFNCKSETNGSACHTACALLAAFSCTNINKV